MSVIEAVWEPGTVVKDAVVVENGDKADDAE